MGTQDQTIQVPVKEFNDTIHRWQLQVFREFDDRKARFWQLNWHRRARKTTFALNLLIRECIKYKNRVYGYIGPTYTQAKSIVWRDPNMLSRYLPMARVKRKNDTDLFIEFDNGSMLVIKGADNPDSIRGMDYYGIVLDEWALMKLAIWEEILRPVITQSADRWAIFTFTPKGKNHAFDYWTKADDWEGWSKSFLPASVSGLIPGKELEIAKQQMPEQLYQQEFECDFLADEEFTLIPASSVEDLKGLHPLEAGLKKLIACDPSYGGDECVIYVFYNSEIVESKYLNFKDTMKIAGEIMVLSEKHKTDNIAIDCIGIGVGVADRLRELQKNVQFINSSEKGVKHYNLRAEMWCYCRDQVLGMKIQYPEDLELRRQLSRTKYILMDSSGRLKIQSKVDIKKDIGHSPDRADCFVYGIWGLKHIESSHSAVLQHEDEPVDFMTV